MKPSFRVLAIVAAAGFAVLAVAWAVVPEAILSRWGGIAFSYPVGLLSRRSAALYAGIAVILFGARNTSPSPARSAIIAGFIVTCSLLALLGTYELATGHVGKGILGAIVLEAVMAAAFLAIPRKIK